MAGGVDSRGAALFLIPVNGGTPRRLIDARAASPLWSPDGALILYSGPFAAGYSDLLAIHPDGTPAEVPRLRVRPGGYRFLPDGRHLVFLQTNAWLDFRVLDLGTKETRPLTRFGNRAEIQTFDIAPDGKSIVFDRIVPNSDIVLIDLPRPGTAAPGPVR